MKEKSDNVVPFFALVFGLSIPIWGLDLFHPVELLPGLPLSALGAFVPAVAALLLTYERDRPSRLLQFFGRSLDIHRIPHWGWLGAAFLLYPIITVLAFVSMRSMHVPIPNPGPFSVSALLLFLVFFVAALGEELGWTGYATQPLQRRRGVVQAGILLGLVWSVWHYIPLLQAHRSWTWIAWWTLGTVSLRLIMGWLYVHTDRSVFAAALFHAMINLCWQLFPVNGSFYDPAVFGTLTFGFAIVILAADRQIRRSTLQPA